MSRSRWKGPFISVKKCTNSSKLTVSRNSKITPKLINLTVNVHNGNSYQEITITEDMLNHKIGEFSFTRKKFSFKKKKSKK